jgi:Tol biopolymer transport system component
MSPVKNSTFQTPFLLSALFVSLLLPIAHAQQREIVDPFFSHDAKKIAYVVGMFTAAKDDPTSFTVTSAELWTANADGSNARRLTSGSIDGNARWSPDGKQIAFLRKGDVWLINSDGSGLRQITKTPLAKERSPEFSNDGKIIFFVRSEQINLAEGLDGQQPLIIDGSGQVIAYSLVSNQERKRFESMDDVKLLLPNRADAGELFLYYNYYDPKVKTKYGNGALTDMVLAAAKLDGSGRRIIQRLPENSNSQIELLRATLAGPLIVSKKSSDDGSRITEFVVATKNDMKKINDGPFAFNDISLDGNFLVGLGPVWNADRTDIIGRSFKIRNATTGVITDLDRNALLGTAMNPTSIAQSTPQSTAPPRSTPVAPATAPGKPDEERRPDEPRFSPDASRLAYIEIVTRKTAEPKFESNLWITNRDGSEARRLTVGEVDSNPCWSPDGKTIAFTRNFAIWLIRTDGTGLRQLNAKLDGTEDLAQFSNDGQSIFFRRSSVDPDDDNDFPALRQSIVMKNLADGKEREILGNGYDVRQIMALPMDDNVIFVLCRLLDNDGKPTGKPSDQCIAVVYLNRNEVRYVHTFEKTGTPPLQVTRFAVGGPNTVFDFGFGGVKLYKGGEYSGVGGMTRLGDVTRDGSAFVGIGYQRDADRNLVSRLIIYDAAGQKSTPLALRTALTPATPPKLRPLSEILAGPSEKAREHLTKGIAAYEASSYGEAIDEYSEALRLHPNYFEALYNRGIAYRMRLEPDNAIADFDAAIKLKPTDADSYFQRGETYFSTGDNFSALLDFNAAIRLNPKSAETYRARSKVFVTMGDKVKADRDEQMAKGLEK